MCCFLLLFELILSNKRLDLVSIISLDVGSFLAKVSKLVQKRYAVDEMLVDRWDLILLKGGGGNEQGTGPVEENDRKSFILGIAVCAREQPTALTLALGNAHSLLCQLTLTTVHLGIDIISEQIYE